MITGGPRRQGGPNQRQWERKVAATSYTTASMKETLTWDRGSVRLCLQYCTFSTPYGVHDSGASRPGFFITPQYTFSIGNFFVPLIDRGSLFAFQVSSIGGARPIPGATSEILRSGGVLSHLYGVRGTGYGLRVPVRDSKECILNSEIPRPGPGAELNQFESP
jgi:hypothetical protein